MEQKKTKKTYNPPSLKKYGLIRNFTTGGSGLMQEVAMGMMGATMQTMRFP